MEAGVLFGRGRAHDPSEAEGTELEALVAARLGMVVDEIDLTDLLSGNPERALAHLPRGAGRCWTVRGWMSMGDYEILHEAMAARGDRLAVTPRQLAEASYPPRWIEALEGETPAAVWTAGDDPGEVYELARDELGPPPWIVKDQLTSAWPWWHRAGDVPIGADRASFAAVCRGLLDGRGDPLRGLVVRALVPLATLSSGPEGRDVVDEHRIFFWKGRPVAHAPHYDLDSAPCDVERFSHLGEVVGSPFFAADVARRADGGWTLVELNDGGSSGLPPRMDPWSLYEAMCEDPP